MYCDVTIFNLSLDLRQASVVCVRAFNLFKG